MTRSPLAALALLALSPFAAAETELPKFLGLTLEEAMVVADNDIPEWPLLAVDLSLMPVESSPKRVVVWQIPPPGKTVTDKTPVVLFATDELGELVATRQIRDVAGKSVSWAEFQTLTNGHVLKVRPENATGDFEMPTFKQLLSSRVIEHDEGSKPNLPRDIGGNVDVIIDDGGITGAPTVLFRNAVIGVLLGLLAGIAAGYYLAKLTTKR